jgi:hypothetical protein
MDHNTIGRKCWENSETIRYTRKTGTCHALAQGYYIRHIQADSTAHDDLAIKRGLLNPLSATGRYIGFCSSGEKCREPIYRLKRRP